ncbi:MAG: M1 family metallopeptidase [Polyangiaceae bacterium]
MQTYSLDVAAATTTRSVSNVQLGRHPSPCEPQGPFPESVASYTLVASLDERTHVVTGKGTIHWRNPSDEPAQELYLHAYLNAFRNERTRFMRDGRVTGRSGAPWLGPGELRVRRLVAREFNELDLWALRAPHSPADPDDDTDVRLPLPVEVPGNGELTLDVEFEAVLPPLIERAGYVGGFHAVTQWFPKIARRTEDGEFRHFAYSALAEFSADFGDYDVTIDVPANYVVAAPGRQISKTSERGRKQIRYLSKHVHDFAWFAWDEFVEHRESIGTVEVRHYGSRDQKDNATATIETLRWALPRLGEAFFAYPYCSLVVVHPPDDARASGGMEYPGLIVTGGPWYLPSTSLRFIESLTLHELAHQWFYGVIASDEYLHPVLDEGITSYVEARTLQEHFGLGSAWSTRWFEISEAVMRRALVRKSRASLPLAQSATQFRDFSNLSAEVYARFATLLETLGNVYGTRKLDEALRAYATRYRFAHPVPDDLVTAVSTVMGHGAGAALDTALYQGGWADYAVLDVEPSQAIAKGFRSRVHLQRAGTLDFPVEVEAELDDGRRVRLRLEHVAPDGWIEWDTSRPIRSVTIDPDGAVTLDAGPENQTFRRPPPKTPVRLVAFVHGLVTAILGGVLP